MTISDGAPVSFVPHVFAEPGGATTVPLPDGSELRIERRDTNDAEQLRDVHAVVMAVRQHTFPGKTLDPFEAWLPFAICDDELNVHLVATLNGEVVGAALNDMPLDDNTTLAEFTVLVLPAWRRRGVGSALVAAMEAATPADRTTLCAYGFHQRTDASTALFAQATGYAVDSVDTTTELALPIPSAVVACLEVEAAAFSSGYRVETFVGGLPEQHRGAWRRLAGLVMVDAPSGSVELEAADDGAEGYAAHLQRMHDAGNVVVECAAFAPNGELVAMSEAFANPSRPEKPIKQGSTYVHREHRGKRLGLAVKLANLRRLTEVFPQHTAVSTCTDSSNAAMVAVNERLGFAPTETSTWTVKRRGEV